MNRSHNSLASSDAFFYERSSDFLEVDVDDWRRGVGATVLRTEGLGPCIGIATWGPATKVGHVGHFVAGTAHYAEPKMAAFMYSVKSNIPDPDSLYVWVRGGQVNYDAIEYLNMNKEQAVADAADARQEALESLMRIGVPLDSKRVRVAWAGPSDFSTAMELNCANGVFAAEVLQDDAEYVG